MNAAEKPFSDIVSERLTALDLNAFAAEQRSNLPPDAIRNVLRSSSKSGPSLSRAKEICEALGLELYVGPPREAAPAPTVRIGDRDYAEIQVYDVDAAAGNGIVPLTEAVSDQLAFPLVWLSRNDVEADKAGLVRVRGDSMSPTVPDGAWVLVDFRGKLDWSVPGIYIIRLDDGIVIKRLVVVDKGKARPDVVLVSDNPAYPPIVITHSDPTSFQPIARVRAVISSISDTSK